ncbi:MAG: hypothetical protein KKE16_01020 [Firmicutes bacterium]|nr:hypothetical protein [Bacillota bacterium]
MSNEILLGLRDRSLTPKEAYKELYPKQKTQMLRRAHFVKIRIRIPDDKAANRLMRIIFLLPAPLFFVKFFLRFMKDDQESLPLSKKEIYELISYRGIKIQVKTTSGENISIKTF